MRTLLYFACLACFCGCSGAGVTPCKTCSDFKTQSEAKSYSNANSSCAGNLDSDSDGIPCEHLPK